MSELEEKGYASHKKESREASYTDIFYDINQSMWSRIVLHMHV